MCCHHEGFHADQKSYIQWDRTGGILAEQWHLLWTNLYNTIIHVKATSSNCSSTSQKTGVLK
jgi:hypothetical protein